MLLRGWVGRSFRSLRCQKQTRSTGRRGRAHRLHGCCPCTPPPLLPPPPKPHTLPSPPAPVCPAMRLLVPPAYAAGTAQHAPAARALPQAPPPGLQGKHRQPQAVRSVSSAWVKQQAEHMRERGCCRCCASVQHSTCQPLALSGISDTRHVWAVIVVGRVCLPLTAAAAAAACPTFVLCHAQAPFAHAAAAA